MTLHGQHSGFQNALHRVGLYHRASCHTGLIIAPCNALIVGHYTPDLHLQPLFTRCNARAAPMVRISVVWVHLLPSYTHQVWVGYIPYLNLFLKTNIP